MRSLRRAREDSLLEDRILKGVFALMSSASRVRGSRHDDLNDHADRRSQELMSISRATTCRMSCRSCRAFLHWFAC